MEHLRHARTFVPCFFFFFFLQLRIMYTQRASTSSQRHQLLQAPLRAVQWGVSQSHYPRLHVYTSSKHGLVSGSGHDSYFALFWRLARCCIDCSAWRSGPMLAAACFCRTVCSSKTDIRAEHCIQPMYFILFFARANGILWQYHVDIMLYFSQHYNYTSRRHTLYTLYCNAYTL